MVGPLLGHRFLGETNIMLKRRDLGLALLASPFISQRVRAEDSVVRISKQYGLGYMSMMVMEHEHLVERRRLLSPRGEAVPSLTDVSYLPRILHNAYAASDTGALVALRGSEVSLSKLVWRDRKGSQIGTVGDPAVYANVALAPDGKSMALDKTDEENQNTDLWTYDLRRNDGKRLTFDPSIDADPVWSHDGRKILFASSRGGLFQLYTKSADGGENEKL